ncbi:unnamed protein product [Callosobruchus maculatus]|uniref:Uncharacterized protein n=1 Tax=Callosobruchus maculatus TaxID=64391 RepID=A0A653DFP8_CALMS|nr:unnamed protein product [Callosobruchus maculatus]
MGRRDKKRKRDSASLERSSKYDLKELQRRLSQLERKERDRELRKRDLSRRSSQSPFRSRSRSRSVHRHRYDSCRSVSVEDSDRRRQRERSIASSVAPRQRDRRGPESDGWDRRSPSSRTLEGAAEKNRTGLRTESLVSPDNHNQACSLVDFELRSGCTAPSTIESHEPLVIHNDIELPEEVLDILGSNPEKPKDSGFELHSELLPRWRNTLIKGMSKDETKALLDKHEVPSNLSELNPPKLNPEIGPILKKSPIAKARDASQFEVQNQLGRGISALGKAITSLLPIMDFPEENLKNDLLKNLCEAGKIFTNLFHRVSVSRNNCILPLLNDSMKEVADRAVPTEFLLGSDLTEKVKSIKNMETICKDLKGASTAYQPKSQKKEGGSTQRVYAPKNFRRPARRAGEPGPMRGQSQWKNRWDSRKEVTYRKDRHKRKE